MKVRIVLALATLFVASEAMAEITLRGHLGGSYSQLTSDFRAADKQGRPGFQFGFSLIIGSPFYVEPGLIVAQRGSQFATTDVADNVYWRVLQIPVLFGWRGVDVNLVTFRLYAGPTLAVVTTVLGNDFDVRKKDLNNTLWGAKVGGGIDVLFLSFDLNYDRTFTKIFKTENAENQTVVLQVGFRF